MKRTLLDTSAYSGLLRGSPALQRALSVADEVCVSVIVLGELRAGFRKGSRMDQNERILGEFLAAPHVAVLGVDEETSHRYAIVKEDLRRRGKSLSANDIWIAATAFQHGLRLVTTDPDFRHVPQIALDLVATAS